MLKTYQFKTHCKCDISFCHDSWQNVDECPYVYKIVFKFKCIQGCWLKQLMSPNLNRPTTSLVHVRASTYNLKSKVFASFVTQIEVSGSDILVIKIILVIVIVSF